MTKAYNLQYTVCNHNEGLMNIIYTNATGTHPSWGTMSNSAHFAHSVRVWEFSIPERLRCRLKRMSSHTEGSPHEIESHVACFQPDYRVGQSTHRDLRTGRIEQREKCTSITFQNRQISVCCCSMLLWSFTSAVLTVFCAEGLRYRKRCILIHIWINNKTISSDHSWLTE